VHSNQKSLREWSDGSRLTQYHLPTNGVLWHSPHTERLGGSHQTPGMVMRVVSLDGTMFFAVADGLDSPVQAQFAIPMLALMSILATITSNGDSRDQPRVTIVFDTNGNVLGKDPTRPAKQDSNKENES
jgi:hypothetical protein